MESIESAGALPKADNGSNETEPNAAENTEISTEKNVDSCAGTGGSLVMAIDNKDDKPPQEGGTVAFDEVLKADVMEPITNKEEVLEREIEAITNKDEVSGMERTSDGEVGDIQEPVEVSTSATSTDDTSIMETMGSVETVSSTGNQQNGALESNTVDKAALEANISEVTNEKSVAKLDDVPVTRPVGSLGLLVQYVSSSDDDDNDETGSDNTNLDAQAKDLFNKAMATGDYRDADDDDDSDETESDYSDVECVGEVDPETIDITNEDDLKAFMDSCDDTTAPKGPIKAKGEFGIDDLPPIADLTITVPESECIQLGTISGVVETLVLVESLPAFAAVDIDTVLFLDKGNRTLGQVFDVMGNVASPIYCVRFNKAQDIVDKKISIGAVVYVAPKTEHTNFIVLTELMNQRGTDASWEDDIEPPTGCGDFSDDEEERVARRSRNQQQRNRNRTSISSENGDGPLPSKVTVKQEPCVGNQNQRGRNRRNTNNRNNRNYDNTGSQQFYKDNRGYANTQTNYTNFQQNRQPMQYDHSWHTAGMIPAPMPSASTAMSAGMQMPMHQGMYPNPFAMASNPMNYGYFNLQAFPPLPPPMSMQPPPTSTHSQRNRHFNNTFNKRNGPHSDKL